ncbi:MAG: ATP-dependent helicase [Thermoprotei archaeon]|nr:MAG: ATP-dependent helicase [Thermoprotei archaeon]
MSTDNVFSLLHPRIQEAIRKRGFEKPTEPQKAAIPLILKGHNVLIIAPTGTGKTEAAILPIFHLLLTNEEVRNERGIKILYITPLRALNRDLLHRLIWWGSELGIRIGVRHGDTDQSERAKQARDPPDMMITTPETFQAMLSGRVLRSHLSKVRWVVIDEVHEIAEDKRGSQLVLGLERLRFICGRDFQVIGLSASVGSPEEVAKFIVGTDRECLVVKVKALRHVVLKVVCPKPGPEDNHLAEKLYTHPEVAARLRLMYDLVKEHRSTLIFVNTRSIAEVLGSRFNVWSIDLPIMVHHGSLSKPSRIVAETGLREGKLKALVCTSSLELGIDIGHVDLVIQYMSPRQVTRLVQRVGRSGHWVGGVAKGVIVTDDPNDTLEALVICRKAVAEELEPIKIPSKPLDVLCHQIVGFLQIRSRWKLSELLEIIRRAYPYRDLTIDELRAVVRYMHERYPRLVWYSEEDDVIVKPKNTRGMYEYFFTELSMIPDEKQYLVVDESTGTPVGILDESFVAEYGEPGIKFIFRGNVWILRSIVGDRIYVVPARDPTGAIPSWVGEEIPVPFEVAQEVGRIRAFVYSELKRGKSLQDVIKELLNQYPYTDESTLAEALKPVEENFRLGYPVPTDRDIVVECLGNTVIVHAHFGTLVNRTLARLIAHVLTEVLGHGVGVQQDPYTIVIYSSSTLGKRNIEKAIEELLKYDIDELLTRIAKRTGLFKRRLIHVARRFGALPKGVDSSSISLRKLVEMFEGTPIMAEALKEFKLKDVDVVKTREVLEDIRYGYYRITILELPEPSPLGKLALEKLSKKLELIPPERLEKLIIESTRARLLNEVKVLVCTSCWKWYTVTKVKEIPDVVSCPLCGSRRIGVCDLEEDRVKSLLSKVRSRARLRDEEQRIVERLVKSSELVELYGKSAIVALSARGLSINDCREVLSLIPDYRSIDFIKLVISKEKEVLKRRFI